MFIISGNYFNRVMSSAAHGFKVQILILESILNEFDSRISKANFFPILLFTELTNKLAERKSRNSFKFLEGAKQTNLVFYFNTRVLTQLLQVSSS